jgi:hypothetical protein
MDHGSRTSERDPSIFYAISSEFAHKLHYFEAIHLLRRETRTLSKRNERNAPIFKIILEILPINYPSLRYGIT